MRAGQQKRLSTEELMPLNYGAGEDSRQSLELQGDSLLSKPWKLKTHLTLPTKVHIAKAMVFPVVMYRCES